MVVQAGPLWLCERQLQLAFPNVEKPCREVCELVYHAGPHEGAVILVVVLVDGTGQEQPGEGLLYREGQVGKMLVVFQQHIVLGCVLADEVGLENQGLFLAFGDNPLDIPDIGEHQGGCPVSRMVRPVKIAPDPVLEHLGLADVDDFPLGVFHDIDAWEGREFRQPTLDMFAELEHCSENSNSLGRIIFFFLSFFTFFIYLMEGDVPGIYGEKMNLENLNVLSQKVDGVLATVRGLRQEVSSLKLQLAETQAELQDRDSLLQTANTNLAECRAALDVRANQAAVQAEALNKKELSLQEVTQKLEQAKSDLTAQEQKFASQANVLSQKETVLAGKEAELAEKIALLAQKNEELEAKTRELTAKDEQLNERDMSLNQKDVQLADKTTLLAQRDEEVSLLKQELAEKETAIADKDVDLAKKTEELAQKTAELAQKDETIQSQAGEIAEIQDKFKQLLATIEKELGSEFPVDEFIAPSATIATATVADDTLAEPTPAQQELNFDEPPQEVSTPTDDFEMPAEASAPSTGSTVSTETLSANELSEPAAEEAATAKPAFEEPASKAAEWSPDPLLQEEPAAEAPAEEPAPEEPKDEFVEDPSLGPIVDMTMSRDDEEDELPEIHAANEKDDDLFAGREGSQGNFFG